MAPTSRPEPNKKHAFRREKGKVGLYSMIPHRGSEPVLLLPLLPLFPSRGLPDPSRAEGCCCCCCRCCPRAAALRGTSLNRSHGPPLHPSKSCHTNRSPIKIKQNKPHPCKTAAARTSGVPAPQHPPSPAEASPASPAEASRTGHKKKPRKKKLFKIMSCQNHAKIMSCHAKNVQKRAILLVRI